MTPSELDAIAARTDIPALLAEVRRLREGIVEMIPYLPFGSTLEDWYPEALTWPEGRDLESMVADYLKKEHT
jgi:hypothetical protein